MNIIERITLYSSKIYFDISFTVEIKENHSVTEKTLIEEVPREITGTKVKVIGQREITIDQEILGGEVTKEVDLVEMTTNQTMLPGLIYNTQQKKSSSYSSFNNFTR